MGMRLGLVIGNSVYNDRNLSRLLAPDADVGSLAEILLDPEIGGFDDVNILVNLSSATVRRAISEFFSRKKRDDLLLLYFSGHGILDDQGRLYLAVKDSDRKLIRGTAIPASFLTDEMDNSMSRRQVLILDCCHSGAFARGSKGAPGGTVGTAAAFEGTGFGRVVLTASDATQYAWEGDQVIGQAENSVFTHYMAQGLRTGEADSDGDGKITVDELYDYVYAQVVRQTAKQTPAKWSYKEQGNIILAHTPLKDVAPVEPVALSDVEDEEQVRLEEYYTKGLSAFWLEEWDKSARYFQAIVDVKPDYEEASAKLSQARRQIKLNALYDKASAALKSQNWQEALTTFEYLAVEAPDFKDVGDRLEYARKHKQLADLYQEAQQLAKAAHWKAVINVFTRIRELDPEYPDPDGLVPKAEAEAAELQRQEALSALFSRSVREMDAGNWEQARQMLAQVQELQPGYMQSEALLERAEIEIARQEAERQRKTKIAELYEQAQGLAQARQWRQASEVMVEVLAIDPDFPDPEGIAETARQAQEKEEQESRRQTELAALYAEAVQLLEAGQYQAALQQWGEVRNLDPGYPDTKGVQNTARKKLESLARTEPADGIRPGVKGWMIAAAVIGVLVIVGIGYAIIKGLGPATSVDSTFIYDDFNDPYYDGLYNSKLWRGSGDCGNVQSQGMLTIYDATCDLTVKNPETVKGKDAGTIGARRMKTTRDGNGKPITSYLTLEARISMSYGIWEARCDQAADGEQFGHIFTVKRHSGDQEEQFYQTSAPGWFNNWYTLELVFDPETMEAACLVNGKSIGSYKMENASFLRDAEFTRTLVNLREEGATGTVQIDDVFIKQP